MSTSLIIFPPKSQIFLEIFNFDIYWYGIIISFSIFIGCVLAHILFKKRFGKKYSDFFLDSIPCAIIFSIIGARAFFVLSKFDYFIFHLDEIFLIHNGGMGIFGAILFGAIFYFFLLKKNKIDILKFFDVLSAVMPLSQAIGRFGNYFNQEAYGLPSSGIVKLYVEEKYRYEDFKNVSYYHPTFLYESLLDFVSFILLFYLYNANKKLKKGDIFYLYLIFYSLIRLFVEQYRLDSIYFSSIPIARIFSIIILIFSSIKLIKRHNKKMREE